MDHRVFTILVFICFALEGAGCAWKWKRHDGEVVVMPLQTGSTLQRHVLLPSEPENATRKSEEKKEPKSKSAKSSEAKPKEVKPSDEDASPAPKRPSPEPAEESPAVPDKFR